ncbi:dihydrofolate reductase family protein [Antrihabitans cavernicola]|uniref:Deaminase n=1 Tax=Antrihabitans cavernicola TaxID=2495913 RepID=A0A5A7SFY5_9NOCA|nr:dihydrofolate reductase family protein [Spelaeibacter cavernicola]KAA0023543.1 deaminase [Spelaeibacter cavernicola]
MSTVIANMSMSLDGYIADRNDGVQELFEWYTAGGDVAVDTGNDDVKFRTSDDDAELVQETFPSVGALISGRRLFDLTDGWGGRHPVDAPVFVVTHTAPVAWPHPDAPFTFVSDGVESAVAQAKAAAGEKTVAIASADITRQCLDAGLVDAIAVDLIPVLLGDGIPFFANLASAPIRLENPTVRKGNRVTHLVYKVSK